MQLNTEDPLGILGKSDPLGILKKKDGGVTPPAGPSPAALLRLEELKKQLNENQLKPKRTELPREAKQAQVRAESIKTKEEVTPKVTPVMFSKTPTFKVEYPEQDELTAKVLGFQSAQQRVQFQEEDQQKKQENTQKAADEFYNTSTGKLYFNFFQPLAESGARAIGNTGATISRLAGEDELADAIVDRFTPEKRYEGTIAGNKPTKLQGGLFNDGKANYSKLPSSFVRGLTDMAWLVSPAGGVSKVGQAAGLTQKVATSTGLIATSFLQSREDYYQEGKASGLKGDALDSFATGAAGLTSALEAVFPNTIAMGGFRSKMAKEYAKQIANGITAKAALKAGAKEVLKEAFVKEPIQEVTQLVGDKVARTLTDMTTGEDNFGDQFDWNKSKDEIYETLVMTPLISLFAAGSGAIRSYTPTNYEKALFYDASKNPQQVNQFLDNKFIEKEITEDQYKQAKQKFANYNTSVEQVKNLGYSEDQTLQMAWELFSGKEKLPMNQSVIADPILKDALGDEIKKDKETISENIKSIGMGIPSVGSDIDGKELSFVISNIGDKGAEIGQGLVDQIGDDTYRVEEVSVKDIYDNNPEFRSYVESYKKGSIDADVMMVPAVLKDNSIVDGRARLAEQFLSGKDRVKIFKNISNAINQSQVQEGRTEGDIVQPQGIIQGQPEVGQREGQQGQTQITPANVSDSNIVGEVVVPELPKTEDVTPEQKKEVIKQKFDFITDQDFVQESFTQEEDVAYRSTLPDSGFANEQEFKNFLETGEYAMLTGQNPEAVPVSKETNIKLNDRAKEWLSSNGLKYIPIFGKYGNSERSFMVPNMTKSQAVEFAKDLSQDSVAHSSGLVYKDGSFNPREEGAVIDNLFNSAEDNFSSINISGSPVDFKIDFDFKTTIPSGAEQLTQELIKEPVAKVRESLKSAGITVDLIEDPAEFDRQVQQLGGQAGMEGVFLAADGKVLLNEQKLKEGTNAGRIIFHEASHPIINIIRNTNPELYKKVVAGINSSSDNPAIQKAKAWVESNKNVYNTDTKVEDETIVETIAMVADGTLDLDTVPTGLKQSIIDIVNLIARALGFGQVLSDTDTAAFKKLAEQITDVLTSGRDIAEIVGRENVREYMSNLESPELVGGGSISVQPKTTESAPVNVYESKETEVLPKRTLQDVYDQYEGKAVVINSDPTRVGELTLPSGKKIFMYGGPGYLSLKDNVNGNVGFATTQISKVNTWMKYVNELFGDKPGVTLVATQAPISILSNSYALRYVMDGISQLPKSVLRSSDFKNEFFGKDLVLLKDAFGDKAYKEFVNKYKKADLSNPNAINEMISEMAYKVGDDNKPASFKARGAFVANLLGGIEQKAKLKTVEGDQGYVSKKPKKYISGQLFNRLGLNAEKVIREIGEPSIVDLYMNEGKWGMAVSGFETDPAMTVESVQAGGIKHPLFNAKFPGKNAFVLDGAYDVNQMFSPIEMTGPSGAPYTKTAGQMLAGSMYVKGQPVVEEGSFEYKTTPAVGGSIQSSTGGRDLTGNINNRLTDDGKGNYVFFHYSGKKLSKIDPSKFGANLATGRDERPGVGLSMYYVDNKTLESGVPSDFGYAVRIPKDKVYPFNEDPLNLYDQAKKEFEKDYPGQAFDANKQIGYITKVANDNGFDITVANWNIKGRKALRAQTTKSLKPEVYKQKVFKNGSEREQFNEELQKLKPGVQASVGNRDIINGFYSPIEDRINTFKQPKASVQKWKDIVGVKSDEAVFSGLADWLGGMKPDRQLSKEEVNKFIKDNRIEINEVVKGKGVKMSQSQIDDVYNGVRDQLSNMDMIDDVDGDRNNPLDVWYNNPTDENYDALGEFTEERGVDLNFIADAENDGTKFSQYQLPGGENYKEVLITLPRNEDKAIEEYNKAKDQFDEFQRNIDMPTDADKLRYGVLFRKIKELENKLPKDTLIQQGRAYQGTQPFRADHFDEANIITHLRMNTRTDTDGKKVLFLEEVQSDWGQKGKREGFNIPPLSAKEESRYWELVKLDDISADEILELKTLTNKRAKQIENKNGIPTAPYVTNTNAWVKLGLKVALKEAVKQGADRIAWTTGEQQIERYDLSKFIKRIDFIRMGEDRYKYEAAGLDGKRIAYDDDGTTSLEEIEGMFGKDIAEKVKSDKYGDLRLQGDGLKVGGKGMKAFYGDAQTPGIVGNVAKALVKELTGKEGNTVESVINTGGKLPNEMTVGEIQAAGGVDAVKASNANSIQPAIDITPELKASVQGGIPQFSVGNRPENNANFKLGAFVMRKKAEGATDGEIAIAIASVTGMKPEDIKTLIDNPEQYIRDMFPSMTKLQQDNLIQKAKIQNIYRGRQFGKPIDKAFTGLEVPQEYVDEYMQRTAKSDNAVKEWATDFKNKWLDPAKGLPDWVLAIKDFASGSKNIEIARASKTIERLKDEAKKIGFTDWDAFGKALVVAKDVKRYIPNEDGVVPFDAYRAAAGKMFTTPDDMLPALVPDEIKALPDEIIPYVYAMRGQIDNLTRDLIGSGYVTPEQAVTLENNIGAYVNRSYRMFNEMGYKPEPEVMNAAIKFLADDYVKKLATDKVGAVPDKQIYDEAVDLAKKDVDAILNKKKNPYFNESTDRRNTGILQERQNISEPLRKLMGEYTDPGTVFMMTVAKQAALKSSSQYMGKLRENGMGTLFFEQNDPSRPASHSVQIAAAGTESMNPLGGLYTTPEIAEAIEMAEPTYNELTQAWMKLVGAVRWGKTVGSVATQFKNFESNLGFAVLNGYLMSGQNTESFKASAKYVKGQYSKAEIDAITDKVIRLNLVGQSVGAREIKEMLGSGDVHDIALDIALNPDGKWGKKVAKKLNVFKEANKLYRLGDDFWKVYAYMTEREQLSDARFNGSKYDGLTKEQQEQIDVESSERVKNTWPTYDRVIEGAKFVSKRAPIFGNFISFQAESLRVLTNSIKMAKQDMADPQLRHLGVRRAVGIAAYFGLRSAITIGIAKMAGFAAAGVLGAAFGDDEEERNKRAIKQALPPFMRTSDLAVIRTKEPHKFTVISLSSLDPYAIIPNSMNAYTEGREGIFSKTMDPGVGAATAELFSSFLEPEMTFSTMWSVVNNIDPKTKQEIVISSDTDAQAAGKVGGKVWDMLEPSSVALVQRFFERKDKEAEILAIGGARPYDVDLHKSFGYILSQFGKDIDAINREYNSIKYREEMSKQDKDAAEMAAEDKKAFAISKINETYRDFMNLGADPKVLNELINQRSAVKVTGFDKNTKNSIKTGKIQKEKLFK